MSTPAPPSPAARPLPARALHALSEFFRLEAAGGIVLIVAAALALVAANSPLEGAYEAFRSVPVQVRIGELDIANARIRFTNGCVANTTASRVSLKTERKLRIFQDDAYMSVDLQQKILTVVRKTAGEVQGDALPVHIEEFSGDWLTLPPENRWRLGYSADVSQLGSTSIVGRRVFQRAHKFRVVLGPLRRSDFQSLLPGSPRLSRR